MLKTLQFTQDERFRGISAFFSPKLSSLCVVARQILWKPLLDLHGCNIFIEREPVGAAFAGDFTRPGLSLKSKLKQTDDESHL